MFIGIPSNQVDRIWDEVEPWISKACETAGGRYIAEDIRNFIKDSVMQLWVYRHEGEVILTCVTEIVKYPRCTYAQIRIATGKKRRIWQHHVTTLERWAKTQGCFGIETVAREGWWRVLYSKIAGWQKTHIFIEKEL